MARREGDVDVMARFAASLQAHRREAGLTQLELAHRSGLSRTFISRVERGESDVTLTTVARLAEGLGVSAAELVATS